MEHKIVKDHLSCKNRSVELHLRACNLSIHKSPEELGEKTIVQSFLTEGISFLVEKRFFEYMRPLQTLN